MEALRIRPKAMRQRDLIYEYFSGRRALLIVLDACRYESFIENLDALRVRVRVSKVYSLGSCTKDWLLRTFTEPLEVVYVTANSWVTKLFSGAGLFKAIDDVSLRFWDEKIGTVRAEHVNLVALKYLLKGENVIVHYIQPHLPFLTKTWLMDLAPPTRRRGAKIYEVASRDARARREFRRAYEENVRYALRHAGRLARTALKLGYKVALTSDHGELLGKYAPLKALRLFLGRKNPRGLLGGRLHAARRSVEGSFTEFLKKCFSYVTGYRRIVGHPCSWPGKELYEVPWAEVVEE